MSDPLWFYLRLAENNAAVDMAPDGFQLSTASGRKHGRFKLPPDASIFTESQPQHIKKPDSAVQKVLNAIAVTEHRILMATRDDSLSATGRSRNLAKEAEKIVATVAEAHRDLKNFAADTQNMQRAHYEVPSLADTDVIGFLKEHEIRQHIRSLGDRAVPALMKQMLDSKNPTMQLAILRSPLPFESLQGHADQGWRAYRDGADVSKATMIASNNNLSDWADPIVRVGAGIIRRDLKDFISSERFGELVPDDARDLFELPSVSSRAA
jgi:hypothetical protein